MQTFTIIGGGSAYAPGLCDSLIRHHARVPLEEIRLYDIDGEHLDVVHTLVARLAEHSGVPLRIVKTQDLADAVRSADVVLNSSRPGGFGCRRLDETLPLEFGIPGQETVGPGGFLFALRSVPEAIRVHDAMRVHAPDATLLNYTNPTNIVTQALAGRPGPRVIGLCDQSDEDLHDVATALGRPKAEVRFTCVGLNHATWYTDIALDGAEPDLQGRSLPPPPGLDEEHQIRFSLAAKMAKAHPGYWPNSYLPYYSEPARFVALSRRVGPRTDAILSGLAAYYEHFREVARMTKPVLERYRGSSGFGDLAVRTLSALRSEAPQRLVLNLVNEDSTPLMSRHTVVEMVARVSRAGIERVEAPIPPAVAAPLFERLERYQLRAAEAAAGTDLALAIDALAENPLVDDRRTAQALMERAQEAYGDRIVLLNR